MTSGNRKKYIVGNWKMNQTLASINDFFNKLDVAQETCETWLAPQAMHLSLVLDKAWNVSSKFFIGAQNICANANGAFTGENSASSLKDLGGSFTLIGHSERRHIFKENHTLLNEKVKQALENDLTVIFCIGELLEERKAGKTNSVISEQLKEGLKGLSADSFAQDRLIIAYEPVWAIGTGEVATPEQAQDAHEFTRQTLKELGLNAESTPILYGGSVKPSNAEGLLSKPDIDGALVGGASLKGEDFTALAQIASKLLK